MWKLGGVFHVDSLWISPRFPAEFIRIFGRFIRDKSLADFQGNPRRFSRDSLEIYSEIRGNLRDIAVILIFLCFILIKI